MKILTLSLMAAFLVTLPIILKNRKPKLLPIFKNDNKKYDINDLTL